MGTADAAAPTYAQLVHHHMPTQASTGTTHTSPSLTTCQRELTADGDADAGIL